MASNKLNFRIKLLAGNNVVLVEADNHDSEIFAPQIVNGRITFLNIIPNRRCCPGIKVVQPNKITTQHYETSQQLLMLPPTTEKRQKIYRKSAGQENHMPKPLANSTPAGGKKDSRMINENRKSSSVLSNCFGRESLGTINSYTSDGDSNLPTPEPMRRAVPVSQQFIDNTLMHLPRGIQVKRLYHNSMNVTPKKVGRLVTSSSNDSQNFKDVSRLNGSFRIPTTPIASSFRKTSTLSSTFLENTTASVTKWRKVITPIRTYTRRGQQPVMIRRPTLVSSAKKSYKTNKVIPTFLNNPTKGPNVTQKIEIRRCRLIKDAKISISPKTFKKQQQAPLSPAPALPHRKSLAQKTMLKQSASYSSALPKSRHNLQTAQMSAFDLLTNSNRYHCMHTKLNEQFRKGCTNKASSTNTKYKILSTVPSLQQDEQILELSRISLEQNSLSQQDSHTIMLPMSISNQISLPFTHHYPSANSTQISGINQRTRK